MKIISIAAVHNINAFDLNSTEE